MRSRFFAVALAGLFAVAVAAQAPAGQKSPEPKPAHPAPPTPAHTDSVAPTELERTQLENIQLRMALLADEEQSLPQRRSELQQRYGELIRRMEAEHPGYSWNPQAGTLVPTPSKPESRKPEAAKK